MSLKPDVAKDLLCIIAHGTLKARVSGAHLFFYYWPALNPTLYDRRGVNTKFNGICKKKKDTFKLTRCFCFRFFLYHFLTMTLFPMNHYSLFNRWFIISIIVSLYPARKITFLHIYIHIYISLCILLDLHLSLTFS